MKKCPYCAEKIQNEAIKCKHCGEWLKEKESQQVSNKTPHQSDPTKEDLLICDDCSLEKSQANFIDDSTICKDCSEKNSKESRDIDSNQDSILFNERSGITLEPAAQFKKKPSRWGWGWGWFILLVLYANGVQKLSFPNSEIGAWGHISVPFFGMIFLLLVYFKIRKRIINRGQYGEATSGASFKAGFLAYIATLLFLLPFLLFVQITDKKQETAKINDFSRQFIEKTNMLTKEEAEKHLEKLITEPKSEADLQYNINILNDYLVIIDKKIVASKEMVDFFNDLSNKRKGKSLSQNIQTLELILNKYHSTSLESIKALISHYKFGDEKSWNRYNELLPEIHKLETEYASALDKIADIIAK